MSLNNASERILNKLKLNLFFTLKYTFTYTEKYKSGRKTKVSYNLKRTNRQLQAKLDKLRPITRLDEEDVTDEIKVKLLSIRASLFLINPLNANTIKNSNF